MELSVGDWSYPIYLTHVLISPSWRRGFAQSVMLAVQ
jgi:peptidoglycan/LPS O-acetylase OafA/YrhL